LGRSSGTTPAAAAPPGGQLHEHEGEGSAEMVVVDDTLHAEATNAKSITTGASDRIARHPTPPSRRAITSRA
jgi:hypothetical protein